MRGLQETLKTIAVIATLWGAVGLAAYFGGAIPTWPEQTPAAIEEDAVDAGFESDAVVTGDDAGVQDAAPVEVEEETLALHRQVLCAAPLNVVWAVAPLAPEGPDVFAIACTDGVQIVGRLGESFVRIATFQAASGATVNDVALGDVDGDGASDLVIAMSEGLYFVPRREDGSFDAPRVLAPLRAGALALAALDANPGLEIAAVHGLDTRPEVWIFRGGLSPLRVGSFAAPLAPTSIATTDLDADGHLDLVVTGATQTTLAFGDSRGGMPRTRSLGTGGTRASGTADGSILIERDGAASCVLRSTSSMGEAGDCEPDESIADALRDLTQRGEASYAWDQPALVHRAVAGPWSEHVRLATQSFGVHRFWMASEEEFTLLGSSLDDAGQRQLELALVHPTEVRLLSDGDALPIHEAPLVTHSLLPDPNTPR